MLDTFLNKLWYIKKGESYYWFYLVTSICLLPLSGIYFAVLVIRSILYKSRVLQTKYFQTPVIVVGNSVIGGQGKTPLCISLANELTKRGLKVGLVASGYKSENTSLRKVLPDSDPKAVGDEPVLLARSTQASVIAGKDRIRATEKLIEESVDYIIHDDGLDHLRLGREMEIIVSKKKTFANTISDNLSFCKLLPSGPWRTLHSLRTSNAVKDFIDIEYDTFQIIHPLKGFKIPIEDYTEKNIHLVLGIALPHIIKSELIEKGYTVDCNFYDDHHDFNGSEIIFNDNNPVFVTMKDYIKLEKYQNQNLWILNHRNKNEKTINNLIDQITKI